MKNALLFSLFLLISMILSAQIDTAWTRCIGGSSDEPVGVFEKCQALVKATPDSNFILVSSTASTDGMMTGNHGYTDVFLAKLNYEGDTIWTKIIGGSDIDVATGVDVDASGNIAICGYSYSTDGNLTGHHGDSLEPDGFIALFDYSGDKIWGYQYGGSDAGGISGRDYLYDVHFASNGDIIATGTTSSVNGDLPFLLDVYDCGWFLRVNEFGTVNKSSKVYSAEHTYENTNDLYRIIALPNGHFVAVGLQWYMFTANLWMVQFDSYGNIDWEHVYGPNSGDVYTSDLEVTTDGGYMVCAFVNNFGGDVAGPWNGGSSDAWVFKTDSVGNIVNQKCFGGSVAELPSRLEPYGDKFLLLGASSSSDGYAPGDSLGYTDMWMVYFNNYLDTLFTFKFGGEDIESALSAIMISDNEMILAGKSSSNTGWVHGNNGSQDIYLARLTGPSLNIWEHAEMNAHVYPNPATEIIFAGEQLQHDAIYRIYNSAGMLVETGTYNHSTGIGVQKLPQGLYWVDFQNSQQLLRGTFVK